MQTFFLANWISLSAISFTAEIQPPGVFKTIVLLVQTGVARSSSGFLGPYERMKGDFLAVDRVKMAGFNGPRGMSQQKTSRNNNVDENSHETATGEEDQAIIFPDR